MKICQLRQCTWCILIACRVPVSARASCQVVGHTFIGKSTNIQILSKALSKLRQDVAPRCSGFVGTQGCLRSRPASRRDVLRKQTRSWGFDGGSWTPTEGVVSAQERLPCYSWVIVILPASAARPERSVACRLLELFRLQGRLAIQHPFSTLPFDLKCGPVQRCVLSSEMWDMDSYVHVVVGQNHCCTRLKRLDSLITPRPENSCRLVRSILVIHRALGDMLRAEPWLQPRLGAGVPAKSSSSSMGSLRCLILRVLTDGFSSGWGSERAAMGETLVTLVIRLRSERHRTRHSRMVCGCSCGEQPAAVRHLAGCRRGKAPWMQAVQVRGLNVQPGSKRSAGPLLFD